MAFAILFFLILFGSITLIGHGIWVMAAFVLRLILGKSNEPINLRSSCPGCGTSLGLSDNFCSFCGKRQSEDAGKAGSGRLGELAATELLLERLFNESKLEPQAYASVLNAISAERERPGANQPRPKIIITPPVEAAEQPIDRFERASIVVPITQPTVADQTPVFSRVEAIIEAEPVSQPVVIQRDSEAVQPRRSWSEMLSAFMEESSIQWGELIGGLLIIGCSIALALSFRSQIAAVPLLKYSVFTGVTAGLFGLGFYSAHRWKLPTTSHGVLIISTLLTPLNFLAMTAFTHDAMPGSALLIGIELAALALFFLCVYQAARVITPHFEWALSAGVLGPSFGMLIARHWAAAGGSGRLLLLGVAPLVFFWVSAGAALIKRPVARQLHLLRLLVLAVFAALLPFGLLIVKSGFLAASLRELAPLIGLFGVPALACSLELWRRQSDKQSEELDEARVAATSAGVIGALIMQVALICAWPNPISLIVVALINCLAGLGVALRYKLRLAHFIAIAHFVFAYLIAGNLLAGNALFWQESGGRLFASFFSVLSGQALQPVFALLAVAAEVWSWRGRRIEAKIYGAAAGAVALVSLVLVSAHGFGRWGDPHSVAAIYFLYAAAWLVIAWRKESTVAAWAGLGLALLSVVQTMAFKFGPLFAAQHPVRLAFLLFATSAGITAVLLRIRGEKSQRLFMRPLTWAALICSAAVTPFILFAGWMTMGEIALRLLWLAILWLTIACVNRWARLLTAFQIVLTFSLIFGVAELVDRKVILLLPTFLDPLMWHAQAIGLSLFGLAWIALKWIWGRVDDPEDHAHATTGGARQFFRRWLSSSGTAIVVWLNGVSLGWITFHFSQEWLGGSSARGDGQMRLLLSWLALASVGGLLIVCLWDRRARFAWPGLYLVGLLAAGKAMMLLEPGYHSQLTLSVVILSGYALAASLLWRRRESINAQLSNLGVTNELSGEGRAGLALPVETGLTILGALSLNFILSFGSGSPTQKIIAASACLAIPLSTALMTEGPRRQQMITISLRLALITLVFFGWGLLGLIASPSMANRLVVVMAVTLATLVFCQALIYGQGAADHVSDKASRLIDWMKRLWGEADLLLFCGLGALATLFGMEMVNYFLADGTSLSFPLVVMMLATCLILALMSLAVGVLPGRDLLGLSASRGERGRMIYVYTAEAFLALALMHTRVALPWLFGGRFYPYWPLAVMFLAFAGVGLSELFRRQGRTVLAEPLEKTGLLLPLLPVIGFWAGNPVISYSGLLLLVGLFYGVLSVLRRSFVFGLLAALAANGGLWRYLDGIDGLGLTDHPQLWLIPAALSVLAAAKINEESLSADRMTTIRYATLMTIYVSSTADIFINGVSESPWLPIILALLSVGGVITGLMLRIRAFLFLGTAFLLLSIVTIIWEASVNLNWTWLWYVSGIAFGALIIYIFAIFERKRQEVLILVEKLKQWQA